MQARRFPKLRYVEAVDEEFICSLCREPFWDPHTTDCPSEHIFCLGCIREYQKESKSHGCPVCGQRVKHLSEASKVLHKVLDSLTVYCTNTPKGCDHTCRRRKLQRHLDEDCQYEGRSFRIGTNRDNERSRTDSKHGSRSSTTGSKRAGDGLEHRNSRRESPQASLGPPSSSRTTAAPAGVESGTDRQSLELERLELSYQKLEAELEECRRIEEEQTQIIEQLKSEKANLDQITAEQEAEIEELHASLAKVDDDGLIRTTSALASKHLLMRGGYGERGSEGNIQWGSVRPPTAGRDGVGGTHRTPTQGSRSGSRKSGSNSGSKHSHRTSSDRHVSGSR